MSFLTDKELEEILSIDINCSEMDKLIITPYSEDSMTAIGYDLRVGRDYYTLAKKGANHATNENPIVLLPNSTTLISTLENIQMPKNRLYAGLIESKVKKVCLGLSHISTTIDPDWSGQLLIAVHNHSLEEIKLNYMEKFCTILFVENNQAPKRKSTHAGGRVDVVTELFSSINFEEKIKENEEKAAAEKKLQKDLQNKSTFIPPCVVIASAIIGAFISNIYNNSSYLLTGIITVGVAVAMYVSKHYEFQIKK